MPLRADLLNPVPGPNPSGEDLRYNPIYDKIREARRQDDDLAQGAWQKERKVADYPAVMKLTQDALVTKSKDLQLAAWLTEALLFREKFGGLRDGLVLCRSLIDAFWDTLYPAIEDGDVEMRATPLDWIGSKLADPVKTLALNAAGHNWFQHKDSRTVLAEDQAKTNEQKKTREKQLKEGKIAPEAFDKSFAETPKAFYLQSEKALDECLEALAALDQTCQARFDGSGPSFGKLKSSLEDVRHTVHAFLQKKRETEPDPVEPAAPEPVPEAAAAEEPEPGLPAAGAPLPAPAGGFTFSVQASSEPAGRKEAIAAVAAAAALLRRREPDSPAAYLMLRGLRWGELRADPELSDPMLLEAPPTEIRQHLKRLALQKKWKELLEAAENVMALPCSRAWLDLQRFVVEACAGLGEPYNPIAIAIRSELKALLRDLPRLRGASLMDDTAAANAETQAWLDELMQEPVNAAPDARSAPGVVQPGPQTAGWQRTFIDSHALALEALRAGQEQRAFEILWNEIDRQRSGRGRFLRKMQLVQLCVQTGKEAIAQTLLDDIAAAIENHKLEEWEDRETIVNALTALMKTSKKYADAKEKQKLFERICRLDPVQALNC
ncbi:MAG TPA: type VI secretion system protein TssA [Bryobacteraceae bacterium]|nr:type VI secretion system protein TssA [Bryobacteraceae bacterium]